MSRSIRKTRILGITTAVSEKQDKRLANRALRRSVDLYLKSGKDPEAFVAPLLREVSNVWCFAKDGKSWLRNDASWSKYRRK